VSGIKQAKPTPNIQTLGPDLWVGGNETPPHEQGLMVLGTPVGSDAYKLQQLQHTRDQHHFLLQRLPDLEGLQAAWLLLLFCANPHCHYNLRMPPPNITAAFSTEHDAALAACLTDLLDTAPMPATSLAISRLPLNQGGARLGFGNDSGTFRLLGFMGRRHPGVTTITGSIRTATSTVAS